MATVLHALGGFAARRWWAVLICWVILLGGAIGTVRMFGSETSNDVDLPGTGSQEANDLLAERFPPQQNGTNPIVFHVAGGKLTDKANKDALTSAVKAMRKAPHVHSVTNPLSSSGKTAGLLSKDKQYAFAPVLMDIGSGELDQESAQKVMDATEPATKAGIDVAAGGSIGTELSKDESETSELVGILAAMFILTLVLGSLVAMGLPIISAVMGLAAALAIVGLLGHLLAVPDTAATIATMIGLGVGIDYALFLISRHQDQLAAGMPVKESIARAVATSGSAIVFAGGTVVVALVALRVSRIPLMSTLGLASAMAVVTAVLAAITLLPAVLGLLGHRVNSLHLPRMRKRDASKAGLWGTWAGFVSRHPVLVTLASLAVVAPLVIPALSLRFGQEDVGATPKSTTERQAYDLLSAGFGVGYNGPLQVASKFDPVLKPSKEYTDKYNKAMSLKKQLDKDQKQLPKEQKQLQAQQRDLENQQAELQREGDSLKQQEAALNGEAAGLKDQEGSLKSRQAELERQQAALEKQAAALKQEGAALQRQGDELKRQAQQLEREKKQLQQQEAQLKREGAQLKRQAEALARQARRVGVALELNLARQDLLQRRIDNTTDPGRRARLQGRLDNAQAREVELRAALARIRRDAQALEKRGKQLEAEKTALKHQADALRKQGDALQADQRALQKQADQLDREKAALQRKGDRLERQADQLRREGASLTSEGDELQKQGDQLQAEGTSLQQQGDQLQKQGDELQKQGDQLKQQKNKADQQKKQAQKLQNQLTDMMTAAGGDARNTDERVVRLQDALSGTSGVTNLTPPQTNKKGDVMVLSAVPSSGPATERTTEVLADVRDTVIPGLENRGGMTSYVGGYTASYVDLATLISERLLLVIGTVILLGFLLLMLAFRSLLVPLQAALTNLLSAAAAFGVLTAAFQWGWGVSLFGIDTASSGVPIASYVPLMMFAVLFGLSMDYEVFLVSHVQQHHAEGQPSRRAVASGLRSSARITTAACLIMTSVFASFILNGDPTIKQFGVGLSAAVLLAGLLVVTLAPAAISLMGEAAWWLPRWLDRILPHMHLEGEEEPAQPAAEAELPELVVPPVYLPGQRSEPEEEEPAALPPQRGV